MHLLLTYDAIALAATISKLPTVAPVAQSSVKMDNQELAKDKKAFWRFRHAQQCFEYVATTSAHVLREHWPPDHPLYYQISIAVAVLYSRPFSDCFGIGKLDDAIVPPSLLPRHTKMLAMRNKVYAHYDATDFADPSIADLQGEVRLNLTGLKATVEIKEAPLGELAFEQMKELSEVLEEKCRYHINRLMEKYKRRLPTKRGIYYLNLSDAGEEFFSEKPTGRSFRR